MWTILEPRTNGPADNRCPNDYKNRHDPVCSSYERGYDGGCDDCGHARNEHPSLRFV